MRIRLSLESFLAMIPGLASNGLCDLGQLLKPL